MMVAMAIEVGLRARKKIKTRQQIYEAAHALFAVRGFDGVTVAEVAQAAEVSEPTVFNYFPTKEDLFFGGLESFEARLVIGVAGRKAGESASGAFLRLLLESSKRLEDGNNLKVIAAAAKLIAASPPLQVREREIVAVYTRELARELALERRQGLNDIEAFTVANALMGLHRALVEHVRRQVTSGARAAEIAAEFRTHARRAFKRLDAGLRGYAVKEAGISNG